jgi:hypothetical protein
MPALVSEEKDSREKEQIEPNRQGNKNCIGEAGGWERGGKIRARTLGVLCQRCIRGLEQQQHTKPSSRLLHSIVAEIIWI